MITELAIMGLTTAAYRVVKSSFKHKEEKQLINHWKASMVGTGVKNKNEEESTFEIIDITKTKYGFDCKVQIPLGISYDKLEALLPVIQTNMAAICELSRDKFDTYAKLKIIKNPLNNLTYEPIKTKPYELLLGIKFTGEPYKINMLTDTHLLIGGIRGSGKSRLQFFMLTTLLKNHDQNEIEVYLMELLKKDLKKFKNMSQVKMFADTLSDVRLMLERIGRMIAKRAEKIDSLSVENIKEYNKLATTKIKYIYIFADEYSLFMEEESDSDIEKEQKAVILSVIKKIAKFGRSVGIFFISGLQRSTVTEINSLVKSQMCRCSFAQLSERDSENIIGITDAKGLKKQEYIVFTGNEYVYLKTPFINNSIINTILGLKQDEQIKTEPEQTTVKSGGWHIPTPDEWKQIRDTIPDLSIVTKEEPKPVGQMEAPKRKQPRKGGVLKLREVLKDA